PTASTFVCPGPDAFLVVVLHPVRASPAITTTTICFLNMSTSRPGACCSAPIIHPPPRRLGVGGGGTVSEVDAQPGTDANEEGFVGPLEEPTDHIEDEEEGADEEVHQELHQLTPEPRLNAQRTRKVLAPISAAPRAERTMGR